MIYRFHDGAPNITVDYVKRNIELFGNITEFEVFRDQEDSPFVYNDDGREERYTFILKDDHENEFWFYTLCGYGGSGPRATIEILQILGLKDDYLISEEGNNHIHYTNLKPSHKLNFLVGTRSDMFEEPVYRSIAKIDFKFAHRLHETRRTLSQLGDISCILKNNPNADREYFRESDFEEVVWGDYATNNTLVFGPEFRSFALPQLIKIIEKVVYENHGNVEFLRV